MPNSSRICVDANVVFRFVADPHDESIRSRWQAWTEAGQDVVAPDLLRYEVINALHRLRRAGGATFEFVVAAWNAALAMPIRYIGDEDLHRRALDFAARFNFPAAYDAHYLALAEREGIEFWTADRRLANTVRPQLGWVRFVEEDPLSTDGTG